MYTDKCVGISLLSSIFTYLLESVEDKKDFEILKRPGFERTTTAIKMVAVLSKPCLLPKTQSPFYLKPTLRNLVKQKSHNNNQTLIKEKWKSSHKSTS